MDFTDPSGLAFAWLSIVTSGFVNENAGKGWGKTTTSMVLKWHVVKDGNCGWALTLDNFDVSSSSKISTKGPEGQLRTIANIKGTIAHETTHVEHARLFYNNYNTVIKTDFSESGFNSSAAAMEKGTALESYYRGQANTFFTLDAQHNEELWPGWQPAPMNEDWYAGSMANWNTEVTAVIDEAVQSRKEYDED